MPRSVQHWPGGIPGSVKPHPETDLTLDQIKEEVKGWLLFVQENWVPAANTGASNDGEYELHQRRLLIEKWASATQELRDSYQSRAPMPEGLQYPTEALAHIYDTLQPGDTNGLISIAPVDEAYATNRARWVKFAILLYNYDFDTGHCLDNCIPSEAILNPETTTNPSIEDFLSWQDLETANFNVYLTRTGTVLNYGYTGPYILVDEEGLRTGRLTMVEYEINGTVKDSLHIRPFNMRMPYIYASTLGKGLDEIRHVPGGYTHQNLPLNMDLPIIDILCQAKAADQLPQTMNLSYREQWMEDVELYAPGYLALEAEGRAGEYSLHRLTRPDSVGTTKKQIWNRLRADPNLFAPNFQFLG
ncbi:uncharacterized protein N7477_007560 [Penicillium maclennaniae]|uniref:uncharacterized protein n=1 Tax=Penicillium maclennaniae TaxID=1343394 RepID=UPI002541AE08|nr:uncharacterized protein N7477_007560 [Penicillium maclennaniae]KAJ5665112.1 hypothetical protein N7477_007560 [Penicillium maclennaniae]